MRWQMFSVLFSLMSKRLSLKNSSIFWMNCVRSMSLLDQYFCILRPFICSLLSLGYLRFLQSFGRFVRLMWLGEGVNDKYCGACEVLVRVYKV